MFQEINFSPFATNVLDCRDRDDLCTKDGLDVTIKISVSGNLIVTIGNKRYPGLTNLTASYLLNSFQVGYYDPSSEKTTEILRD